MITPRTESSKESTDAARSGSSTAILCPIGIEESAAHPQQDGPQQSAQATTQEGEGGSRPADGLRAQDDRSVGTEPDALSLGLSERPKIDAPHAALEELLSSGDVEKLAALICADGNGASVERS